MRIRFALLLMVAGLLMAAGVATAQTTDTTGSYTTSTPTGDYTTSTPTTTDTETETDTQGTDDEVAPTTAGSSGAAPAVAGTTQQAPQDLAFTGAEPLLLIVLGLAAAGGTATLLVRDRRRASQDR